MSARTGLRLEWTFGLPRLALLLVCLLGLLMVPFSLWTATSIFGFPQFILAVLLLIYLPGELLVDAADLQLDPLDDVMLALVLGMTAGSVLYYVCSWVGLEALFLAWPVVAAVGYVWRRRSTWSLRQTRVTLNASHLLLLAVLILCLLPLAVLPMYYRNLARLPEDGMAFLRKPNDAIFHLSIAQELTHTVPPEAPFLAGRPLGYHCGLDLLVAMLARVGRLSVLDLTVRFVPTFLLLMTLLAVFCFCRTWLGSANWAALCAMLVFLGEDFSFVPGLLTGSAEVWSAQFFGVPTTFSLYFMNPMLPALGLLFCGLYCLIRYWRSQSRGWLVLTAFIFAIAMEYKVFVTAQVGGALALAALVYLVFFRDRRLAMVTGVTLLMVLPLGLYSVLGSEAGSRVWMRLDPWPYIPEGLEQLGLLQSALGREIGALFQGGPVTLVGLAGLLAVALPLYVVGSLGVRVLAVPRVVRGFFAPRADSGVRFFLSVFCILGPAATLLLSVTPSGYPPEHEYNNAVWFYVQSKYVVWVLVAESVAACLRNRRSLWKGMAVAAIVALSVPSSLQYFGGQLSYEPSTLGSDELELTDFVGAQCPAGQVVLSRQAVGESVAALTTCRVPYLRLGIYPHSFVSMEELAQRREDTDAFWRDWNEGELRTEILDRYGIEYVVVDRRAGDETWDPGDSSSGSMALKPVFENGDFTVYEVRSDDAADS
jgi:hypothetical protein